MVIAIIALQVADSLLTRNIGGPRTGHSVTSLQSRHKSSGSRKLRAVRSTTGGS